MDTQQGLTHQNHGASSPSSVDSSVPGASHEQAATLIVHGHSHGAENGSAVNVPEAMKAHVEALQNGGDVKPLVHVDQSVEVPTGLTPFGTMLPHEQDYTGGYPAQASYLPQSTEDLASMHKQKKHKEDKELSQKRRKQKEEKRVVKAFIKVATVPTVPLPSVKSPTLPGDQQAVSVKSAESDMEWKQQTLRPLDKQQLYNLFEKHVKLKDVASSVFWKYVLNSVYKNKQVFKTTRPNGLRCLTGVQFRCNLHDDKVREDIKPYIEKLEKYLIFGVDALLSEVEGLSKSSPEKPKHGNTGKKKRKRTEHGEKGDDDKKDKKKNLTNSSDSINTPTGMDETVITTDQSAAITSIFEVMQLLSNPNIARAMKILAGTDISETEKEMAMQGISNDEMIGLEKLMNLQMLLQQQHQLMPLLQQLQQLQLQQLQQQQQLVEQQQAMAAEQHTSADAEATPITTAVSVDVPPQ